jgi:hypothetical protein
MLIIVLICVNGIHDAQPSKFGPLQVGANQSLGVQLSAHGGRQQPARQLKTDF